MERTLLEFLAGVDRMPAREGGGLELRLLAAKALLEARHETERMTADAGERALHANACLLARTLWKRGEPAFDSGEAVLAGLTAEQIGSLAAQWAELNGRENPSVEDGEERVNDLKKLGARALRPPAVACAQGF
jgi:hypothetical protein